MLVRPAGVRGEPRAAAYGFETSESITESTAKRGLSARMSLESPLVMLGECDGEFVVRKLPVECSRRGEDADGDSTFLRPWTKS